MKKILLLALVSLFLGVVSSVGAQLIDEGFDDFDTGTRPTGWTFTNCNADSNTWTFYGYYGVASPSVVWKGSSGVITTETFASPSNLQFWLRGSGTQSTSSLLVEEFYSAAWNQIAAINPIPASETTQGPWGLNAATTRLSFKFTHYSGEGNCGIDDVLVGSLAPSPPPPSPTPSSIYTPTPTPLDYKTPTPTATMTPSPVPTVRPADVVINEVAWMGTVYSSADQWIELYNNTAAPISLTSWCFGYYSLEEGSGWSVLSGTIEANDYFLMVGTDHTFNDLTGDLLLGWTLSYYGERFELWNIGSELVDEVDCTWGWFAGSYAGTMERINPTKPGLRSWNWATWNGTTWNGHDGGGNQIKGTAGAQNSVFRLYSTPTPSPRVPTPTPSITPTPTPTPTASPRPGPISGRVYDKISGLGIPNVYMRALSPTGIGTDITDGLGDYEITGLDQGIYRVMADPSRVTNGFEYDVQYYDRKTDLITADYVGTDSSDINFPLIRHVPTPPTPTPAPTVIPPTTPPPTPDREIVLGSGDYNGDGTSDIAVFRPGSGMWAIRGVTNVYYGTLNDIPTPADYDGDGSTDIAIFRLSSGMWAIRDISRIYYGNPSDLPVPADYDGDGFFDIGIFRPPNGLWAIRALSRTYFGAGQDQAIPGDYDGDGCADIAVFRSAIHMWALRDITREYFGIPNDKAVPADYDGDGITDIAVYRSYYSAPFGLALWAVKDVTRVYVGQPGDHPVPADYDGDGLSQISIFRSYYGLWAIPGWSRLYYGSRGDIPVTR